MLRASNIFYFALSIRTTHITIVVGDAIEKIEKWQNMAGSREVRPALLAGIREGIAARGSRRQSVNWALADINNVRRHQFYMLTRCTRP